MIPADQALIRTGALAAELGVHKTTVISWGRTKLAAARFGRGVFLVQRLRDIGVLPRVTA
jgi:hypothetical protein